MSAYFYFQDATERYFPDMMHGWNCYANDNISEAKIESDMQIVLFNAHLCIKNIVMAMNVQQEIIDELCRRIERLETGD